MLKNLPIMHRMLHCCKNYAQQMPLLCSNYAHISLMDVLKLGWESGSGKKECVISSPLFVYKFKLM